MNCCTYDNSKPTSFDGAYFANLNSIEKYQDKHTTKSSECQEFCHEETCEILKTNDKNEMKINQVSLSIKDYDNLNIEHLLKCQNQLENYLKDIFYNFYSIR